MGRRCLNDEIGASITESAYPGKSAKFLAELRHRLRRASAGLCSIGGCKETKQPLCDVHRAKVNERARKRNAKRRQNDRPSQTV